MTKLANSRSLAYHLSLWIISLGALIFIVVLSTNYFLSRHLLDKYVEELAKTTTSSTVRKIETIFNSVAINADSLAAVVAASETNENQIHQNIKAFLKTNTNIFGMAVALEPNILIDELGDFSPYYYKDSQQIIYSDLTKNNYQYKTWPWYSEPKKSNQGVWAEPYFDDGGGDVIMTTYSAPIYLSNTKTFAGVATADIQLSWLNTIVNEIKLGETGFGFIISQDDIVIAHPDKSLNMKKLDKDRIGSERWQKYLNSKTSSSSVYLYTQCLHRDGYCWIAIETLSNVGWKVAIVLPEQELISEINSLTVKISLIAITGLIILFVTVTFITRRLTGPLGSLAKATKDIGTGNLDTQLPKAVRNDEIGTLTDDFSSMRENLKTYIGEIQLATAKQQKHDSEIQIAQDIQMSMIPGAGNVYIEQDNYQIFAFLKAAKSVGGDLYYYQQTENTLHFMIGDVSDKGIPAALFMAKTVTLYTRALRDKLSPGKTFTMMNDMLADNNDACMFVTALCGTIDLNTGDIVMANAGHMDPIVQNTTDTKEYSIDGATALGLMEGVGYPDVSFRLESSTSLVMYTDGISEAHDLKNNQYTDEKLIELITEMRSNNTEETGKQIIESVDAFAAGTEQFDDITLLIIQLQFIQFQSADA